jgi:hypothetical protein
MSQLIIKFIYMGAETQQFDRKAAIDELKELKVEFRQNISNKDLAALLAKARAEAAKKEADEAADQTVNEGEQGEGDQTADPTTTDPAQDDNPENQDDSQDDSPENDQDDEDSNDQDDTKSDEKITAEEPERLESKEEELPADEEDGDYLRKYQYRKQCKPGSKASDPQPGGKAAIMKKQLLAQPKVTLFVPRHEGEDPSIKLSVNINGYRLDLPKQTYLEVPQQVAEIIKESLGQTEAAIARNQIAGNKEKEKALN